MTQCNFRSYAIHDSPGLVARALRYPLRMNPRNVVKKNLEAIIIVVVSTGLAILSADHFERSGPDHVLLRQLKEIQEARRERNENAGIHRPMPTPDNASTSGRVAQR